MTTYDVQDNSPHSGRPIEIYEFRDWEKSYFYTNSGSPIVYNGNTYLPVHVKRGQQIIGDLTDSASTLEFTFSIQSQIAQDNMNLIARPGLEVIIYRLQRGTTGFRKLPSGVTCEHSYSPETGEYSVNVKNKQQALVNRSVAAVYFQNACNNEFGDARCKVDVLATRVNINITGGNAAKTEIITSTPLIAGDWEAGYLLVNGQARKIVKNTATVITIAYPFVGSIPVAGTLQKGCKKDYATCGKYNNQKNYTGFRDIPSTNPAESPLNKIIADFLATKKDDVVTWQKTQRLGIPAVKPTGFALATHVPSPWAQDGYGQYKVTYGTYPPPGTQSTAGSGIISGSGGSGDLPAGDSHNDNG